MLKPLLAAVLVLSVLSLAGMAGAQPTEETTMTGNEAFTFDFYAQIKAEEGNLFFSPHSILSAFWLAYLGADGDTATQMAEALHLPVDRETAALPDIGASESEDFVLRSANALWAQEGYPWRPDYLAQLEALGSPIRLVDYLANPEGVRQQINQWVEDETEDKIQDLIPQGAIDELTRLTIANAVYFKATWLTQFVKELTQDAPFTLLDGSTVTVPMMSMSEGVSLKVFQGDGFVAVALPYVGSAEMLILLPDAGQFENFEAALTAQQYRDILAAMQPTMAQVSMPSFTFDTFLSLGAPLEALGMSDAFDPEQADFGRMYNRSDAAENLYITAALHKAFVDVNEQGTEAAAATGVIFGTLSMPAPALMIRVDRPFLFAIRETQTDTILFMGRVVSP
ncbi:MAG: serpin family protein [Anaerolineae bacterium]|nr:serpin family protein [Anaerolineae bacterium]